MYRYRVGYETYEESCYREFYHEDRMSARQLNAIVADCIAEAAFLGGQVYGQLGYTHTFQQFMPDNGQFIEAMSRRGFVQIEYEACSCVFGWNSILDPDDWKQDCDEETLRAIRRIRRRLSQKIWRANLKKDLMKDKSSYDYILLAESERDAMSRAKKFFNMKTSRGILLKRWSPKNKIRLPKKRKR